MTAATLVPPTTCAFPEAPRRRVSAMARLEEAVGALPAPTLPNDAIVAHALSDVASTHILDAHTLAVVARRDRHIQPIAAMIIEHLIDASVDIVGSAIIVSIARRHR